MNVDKTVTLTQEPVARMNGDVFELLKIITILKKINAIQREQTACVLF